METEKIINPQEAKKDAIGYITMGILLIAGSGFIAWITSSNSGSGGYTFLFWGAFLVGGNRIVRGIQGLKALKKRAKQ